MFLERYASVSLGRPFDSCIRPSLIISGGGPLQWNAVGHSLLAGLYH